MRYDHNISILQLSPYPRYLLPRHPFPKFFSLSPSFSLPLLFLHSSYSSSSPPPSCLPLLPLLFFLLFLLPLIFLIILSHTWSPALRICTQMKVFITFSTMWVFGKWCCLSRGGLHSAWRQLFISGTLVSPFLLTTQFILLRTNTRVVCVDLTLPPLFLLQYQGHRLLTKESFPLNLLEIFLKSCHVVADSFCCDCHIRNMLA